MAARQLGLCIPQDLSVVGFDGIDPGNWCGPPLTTVRQPFRDIGAAAANLLLALLAGEAPAQTRIEMPTTLIVRASTAPHPGPETFREIVRNVLTGCFISMYN